MKTINNRTTEYNIDDIFLKRYSSRAMNGQPIAKEILMTLFESAHWAPSSLNSQPWRFLYAIHGTPDFDLFLSFIKPHNVDWCKNAGALIIVFSKKTLDNGNPNLKHSLDTGSAWENLALQATFLEIVAHAMGGFNDEPLRKELNIIDEYKTEIMIAVGYPGVIEDLPEPLREREKPSGRKNLEEIVFEGKKGAINLV